ncbi:YqhA family protein [Hassallia byssoidea VB512170]|uniref:YqhA family protein n=1 Tax=Hassallia byssoidea VB512170 TaxID=1304833 RepID=A0A846HAY0_9CYAN|nr:YqhA family protein [Hassalia byssoidea]NEU74515.1 YqhA family protein [Hassalia byssoidea VB512170]
MIHRILASSRQLILLAVICSFIASVTVLLYGVIQTGNAILQVLHDGAVSSKGGKKLVVSLVEVIDLFLLSTVFYITALGLYELFIDDNINVPEWLEIHNIDDLKGKLISVIIVVLSVLFLGQAVTWSGDANFLTFGGSVALVIASLTYFLSAHKNYKK